MLALYNKKCRHRKRRRLLSQLTSNTPTPTTNRRTRRQSPFRTLALISLAFCGRIITSAADNASEPLLDQGSEPRKSDLRKLDFYSAIEAIEDQEYDEATLSSSKAADASNDNGAAIERPTREVADEKEISGSRDIHRFLSTMTQEDEIDEEPSAPHRELTCGTRATCSWAPSYVSTCITQDDFGQAIDLTTLTQSVVPVCTDMQDGGDALACAETGCEPNCCAPKLSIYEASAGSVTITGYSPTLPENTVITHTECEIFRDDGEAAPLANRIKVAQAQCSNKVLIDGLEVNKV